VAILIRDSINLPKQFLKQNYIFETSGLGEQKRGRTGLEVSLLLVLLKVSTEGLVMAMDFIY